MVILSDLSVRKEGLEIASGIPKNIQLTKWNSSPDLPSCCLSTMEREDHEAGELSIAMTHIRSLVWKEGQVPVMTSAARGRVLRPLTSPCRVIL